MGRLPGAFDEGEAHYQVGQIRQGLITRRMVEHNLGVGYRGLWMTVETLREWRRGTAPNSQVRRDEIRARAHEDVRWCRIAKRVLEILDEGE